MQALLDLNNRLSALERRVASTLRHGVVAEVTPDEGWVRLDLGPGASGPMLSPKIPYAQMAGALKVHAPPSVGQQMTFIAPDGDMRQAIALPMTWSAQNASPGETGEPALTFGNVRIDLTEESVKFTIGGMSLTISESGVSIDGGDIEVSGGGVEVSEDVVAGSISLREHVHDGVDRGPDDTNPPKGG